jgi:hypothetical protein
MPSISPGEPDEQAELGDVLDLALEHRADRVLLGEAPTGCRRPA